MAMGGYSMTIFTPMQKKQPHSPGTKFYMQSANLLQAICIKCVLKHISTTPMGILDILKQHYFQPEYPFNEQEEMRKKILNTGHTESLDVCG